MVFGCFLNLNLIYCIHNTNSYYRPAGPEEVILTGTFDNWSQSQPLVKQRDGSFKLDFPITADHSGKLLFKFVVDGVWKVSSDVEIERDEHGNENNVLDADTLKNAVHTTSKGAEARIPEIGDTSILTATGVVPVVAASAIEETTYVPAKEGEFKTTVQPVAPVSQASVTGEPGIQIPQTPEALSAFETVRDVDPKTLNEEISAEEKAKQKKKVKRAQYKAKKKKKAAAAAAAATAAGTTAAAATAANATSSGEDDTEETAESTPEPEVAAPSATGAVGAGALAASQPEADVSSTAAIKSVPPTSVVEPEPEPEVVAEPEVPHTLDPKVNHDAINAAETATTSAAYPEVENDFIAEEGKNVDQPEATAAATAAVAHHQGAEEEEEIIAAKGDREAVAAAIAAEEGHPVEVEEVEPTKEQKKEAEEAEANAKESAADAKIKEATAAANVAAAKMGEEAKVVAAETKKIIEEKREKRKSGFSRFLKKIFK